MGGDNVESFVRKRDGMIEFYRKSTNEYGVVSPEGIIKTYYPPERDIAMDNPQEVADEVNAIYDATFNKYPNCMYSLN